MIKHSIKSHFEIAKRSLLRVATGKNEKEYSWHVPAMKFIGMKQLV